MVGLPCGRAARALLVIAIGSEADPVAAATVTAAAPSQLAAPCQIDNATWPKGVAMHVYTGGDHHTSECRLGAALPRMYQGSPVICELDCAAGYAGAGGPNGALQVSRILPPSGLMRVFLRARVRYPRIGIVCCPTNRC